MQNQFEETDRGGAGARQTLARLHARAETFHDVHAACDAAVERGRPVLARIVIPEGVEVIKCFPSRCIVTINTDRCAP